MCERYQEQERCHDRFEVSKEVCVNMLIIIMSPDHLFVSQLIGTVAQMEARI